MGKFVEQIRVFISSPSDVSEERKAAKEVIEELNRTICYSNGITLKLLTWEKDTFSSVGEYPQDVINKQIGEYDVFVGIMANRFGTPTPEADSGTEEEFNIAYKMPNKPHIMFFFKKERIDPDTVDIKQFIKVQEFKQKISKMGVYYKVFSEGFEKEFRESLTMYLAKTQINKMDPSLIRMNNLLNDEIPKTAHMLIDFENYLHSIKATYDKCCSINVLAIRNAQFKLKEIYVAQTLVKDNCFEEIKETTKIDRLPVQLIRKYQKILIKDTAGMGKSTIMKYMFIDLYENKKKDLGIPIYIELNRLTKEHTLIQAIKKELKILHNSIDNDSFIKIFQNGGFIFFLDGYDEIPISEKCEVAKDLNSFITDIGVDNYYVISSRPEEDLSGFGGVFKSFFIQPLIKDEAFELLEKYDLSDKKVLSKKLIELLKTGRYDSINEYLENPLLVSLLYTAYDYKNKIPLKKYDFYKQVYEAFFKTHDMSKNIDARPHIKQSGLDIDDFSKVLNFVGYICFTRVGVKFDERTATTMIKNAKIPHKELIFDEFAFLQDLLLSVPLFSKDGNEYKWVHKSLMEFFAAQFIASNIDNKQKVYLKKIYDDENNISNYWNFFDLYCDIDKIGFSRNIALPFLEEYVKYYDSHHLTTPKIDEDLLEARISLLYFFERVGIKNKEYCKAYYFGNVTDPFLKSLGSFSMRVNGGVDCYYGLAKYNSERLNVITGLMRYKMPSLFIQYRNNSRCTNQRFFGLNKFYEIDVMTGADNVDLFILINDMLNTLVLKMNIYSDEYLQDRCYYLDYKSVAKEVARIKKDIVEIENNPYLKGL